MAIKIFISTLLVLTIILGLIYCKSSEKSDKMVELKTNNLKYSKIEIYCWYFLTGKAIYNKNGTMSEETRYCNTTVRMNPSELIKPEYLFDSTSNSGIIEELQKIFFSGKEHSEKMPYGSEPRFLVLFKENELKADTLVYLGGKRFVHNDKYLFTYPYNVLDSVRKVLHVDKIDCKS